LTDAKAFAILSSSGVSRIGFPSPLSLSSEEERAAKDCQQDTGRDRIQTERNALVHTVHRATVTRRGKRMMDECNYLNYLILFTELSFGETKAVICHRLAGCLKFFIHVMMIRLFPVSV
jgi:hypothetical protein